MVPDTGIDGGARARWRGCRVVTTSLTARVLLANQLRSLPEIDWTVVSGDRYDNPIDGVPVEVIPIRREFAPSDIRSVVQLWHYLRRQRFDVVQTHTPKASFLGLPVARVVGSPAVYTVHGSLYFAGNSKLANILGWCFERWCCSWATSVLVQSREDEGVLPRVHIAPAAKIHYVGNGIVLDRFLAPVAPALTSDRPIVLMVSRLVREKGCADFLEIAARLSHIADFVHVAAAADTVTFVGEVADVRPYLSSAALVVLPSYREGIPRAAMEAAATGRPVAAYDIRGVREVIDSGLGLLAPRGDVTARTEVVASLVGDPDRGDELGKLCRERIVERFSEDLVIERLRAFYAATFEGREPTAVRGAA
jgi:glycosyltransferase involved in cell wall biosynthesis